MLFVTEVAFAWQGVFLALRLACAYHQDPPSDGPHWGGYVLLENNNPVHDAKVWSQNFRMCSGRLQLHYCEMPLVRQLTQIRSLRGVYVDQDFGSGFWTRLRCFDSSLKAHQSPKEFTRKAHILISTGKHRKSPGHG